MIIYLGRCKSILLVGIASLCSLIPVHAVAITPNYQTLKPISGLGMNGQFIGFTTGTTRPGAIEHIVNLGTMSIEDERLPLISFQDLMPARDEYSLTFGLDHHDRSRLELRHLGRVQHVVDWSNLPGSRHQVFGFLNSGRWLSGGNSGVLEIFNCKAEKLASLEGHSGVITAAAFDAKWLVSADSNGLILLWNLDDVTRGKKKIKPYLHLASSREGEWAIWSDEGIFSGSSGAHSVLNLSAELASLYRKPELLAKKVTLPEQYHKLVAAELRNDKGVFNTPSVAILKAPTFSQARDVEIEARICDTGGGVQSAMLYLRGVPIVIEEATRGIFVKDKNRQTAAAECTTYSRVVSLADGENDLVLVASNSFGKESASDKKNISFVSEKKKKPNLHILTIAVSAYGDQKFNLTYPVDDAVAISGAFEKAGYDVFKSVQVHALANGKAKKSDIGRLFAQLKNKVDAEDVVILFMAGHGLFSSSSSEYYFLPYDVKANDLLRSSLGTEELMKHLSGIKAAQMLLLVDTCQSGGFEGFAKEAQQVNAVHLKFAHRLGRASLMASSKEQVAFEGVRGHGAFTAVILDALKGEADYTSDKLITVDELSVYVSKHLPELTERRWGYRQEAIRNTTGHDFVLGGIVQ